MHAAEAAKLGCPKHGYIHGVSDLEGPGLSAERYMESVSTLDLTSVATHCELSCQALGKHELPAVAS